MLEQSNNWEAEDAGIGEVLKRGKVSLNIYLEDWQALTMFRTHKVISEADTSYTIADAIIYSLSLLKKEYKIPRVEKKITLVRGRRTGEKRETKRISVDLHLDKIGFINDFLPFKFFPRKILRTQGLKCLKRSDTV